MLDWTPIIVAIIAATPGFLGSLILLWRLAVVHRTFNSKMDRMLALTADAARAEGKLEGKAEAEAKSPPHSKIEVLRK
jgi:hypothetical protein